MDRFIVRLTMGYPAVENEVEMLKSKQNQTSVDKVQAVANGQDIIDARKEVENIYVADQIFRYIALIADATRNNQYIKLGLSPRGTIALLKMTKATALLKGRDYVLPDDVLYSLNDVVLHRIILNSKAKINGLDGKQILEEIVSSVEVPRIKK
jgi:MoxR-like ATPase